MFTENYIFQPKITTDDDQVYKYALCRDYIMYMQIPLKYLLECLIQYDSLRRDQSSDFFTGACSQLNK